MDKYENLVEKAKKAYQNEQLEMAAKLYEEAFQEQVQLDDLMHLGAIYIDLKNYNKAIKIFNDLISIQDDNFLAHYGLASCYNDLGRINDAINSFKDAIRVKPNYSDAYFGIALLLDYEDNPECEKYYLKTIEYEPDHYWANANLGPFYDKQGKLDLALYYASKAYEIDSSGKLTCFNLGVILAKLNRFDEAVEKYLEEIEKDNPYIYAYLNLGLLYKDIYKNYDKALLYYLEGISKDKDHVDLWYNLGCLYVVMGDEENAFNCLMYANLKDLKLRDFMNEDKELEKFRKTETYKRLLETINGK